MSTAPVHQTADPPAVRDRGYYLAACVLGAIAGWSQIALRDISLLLVSAFTLFLAVARPQRPWRWALIVGLGLPAAELLTYVFRWHPLRGAVAGSFLALVPAMMCAYGGALLRRAVGILFPPK